MIRRIRMKLSKKRELMNLNIPYKVAKSGVSAEKRQQEIVVSLTTYPGRINTVHKTIITLLNQELLPDHIVLWLAKEQFEDGNEALLPKKLVNLKKYGLEIEWCDDIRSYKKLIPSLKRYPNALIVTVDDDWYYSKTLLSELMKAHSEYPQLIISNEITHPEIDDNGKLKTSLVDVKEYLGTASFFNKVLGCGGVLYPPHSLSDEVFNQDVFMNIASTNDDIWFWAMAVKNGVKTLYPNNAIKPLLMTDPANQSKNALALFNSQNNTYIETTEKIFALYPEVYSALLNELDSEKTNCE